MDALRKALNSLKVANQITGPNANGQSRFPFPTLLTARVGQFCRSAVTFLGAQVCEGELAVLAGLLAWFLDG